LSNDKFNIYLNNDNNNSGVGVGGGGGGGGSGSGSGSDSGSSSSGGNSSGRSSALAQFSGCAYTRICGECGECTCCRRKKVTLMDIQQQTAGFCEWLFSDSQNKIN
jgi:hypothetical protein